MKWLTRWLSKSSPAKWVSPAFALTSKIPSLMVKRDIEGSSTEIENEHVALADHLLVETVRDSSSRGLVDNTKDIHARDGTNVLGSLLLRVVEVRGDSDNNSIIDGVTQVRLSSLLHLEEHHGRNLFRRNSLVSPRYWIELECRVSLN